MDLLKRYQTNRNLRRMLIEDQYQRKRERVKRNLTRNLGKVIEEEDRLVCYVDKNKIEKDKYSCTMI